MKNKFAAVFINTVFVLLVFIVFDWFLVLKFHYDPFSDYERTLNFTARTEQNLPYQKNKPSIVTVGCSFVYGYNLPDEETLAYKLQKLTKRKTYNLGVNRTGIQHVLYRLQYMDFFQKKEINPEPEYVIYIFITDHLRRMYADYFSLDEPVKYLRYENKNGEFKPRTEEITFGDRLKVTYTGKKLNELFFKMHSQDKQFDLFKKYVKECQKALNSKYPNAKFVIIVYNPFIDAHSQKPFKTDRWKELEDEGIIVLRFDTKMFDFLNEEPLKTTDENHPSGKAWDILTPIIIRKLNL